MNRKQQSRRQRVVASDNASGASDGTLCARIITNVEKIFATLTKETAGSPETRTHQAAKVWRTVLPEMERLRKQLRTIREQTPALAWEEVIGPLLYYLAKRQSHLKTLLLVQWGLDTDTAAFNVLPDGQRPDGNPHWAAHNDPAFCAAAMEWRLLEALWRRTEAAFETAAAHGNDVILGSLIDAIFDSIMNFVPLSGIPMRYGFNEAEQNQGSFMLAGFAVAKTIPKSNPVLLRSLAREGAIPETLIKRALGATFEAWCDTEDTNDSNQFLERVHKLLEDSEPHDAPADEVELDALPDQPSDIRDEEFWSREEAREEYANRALEDTRASLPEYLRAIFDDKQAGIPIRETATRLGISDNTVKGYRADIKRFLEPAADAILASS